MSYKITQWTGSDWKDERGEQIQPGEYDLYVTRASYDEQTHRYTIAVEDVQTGAQGSFSWYLVTRNGDTNKITLGTLITLGKAVFGQNVGVPFPDDIVHSVVHAVIELGKPYINSKGETVQYPNIFKFDPTSKAIYVLVAESGREIIEQYTTEEAVQ